MAATAASLFGDRLILGLGVGYLRGEFELVGAPPFEARGAVTTEYVRLIRLLFEAEAPISFDGQWVSLRDAHFGPRPAKAPPLVVGGNGQRALERAAKFGDGWHPLFPTPATYKACRASIDGIRAAEGIARPFIYSYSCAHTRIFAHAGEATTAPHGGAWLEGRPKDFDYAPAFPMTDDGRQYFVGTAAEVRADIELFAAMGVEQLVLRFALPWDDESFADQITEQLQRFQNDVVPYLEC